LVFGDPTRLNQILTNLINNAIKFTQHGEVKLSCEIRSIEHDIANFVFKIKDSGIGISSDKIESIFERFNQGNAETTRKYGGTGLGLAIVKQLVEIQNGTISIKSKEGEGTEFTIALSYPISYETPQIPSNTSNQHLKIVSTKTLKVLLTEDNVLNQKLATTYLIGFGLNVDLAENGLEAIEKLKHKNYDLVIMDIQMPVLDGYSASEKIRHQLGLTVPIIAMTANVMPDGKEKCIRYGMNDYISKPFKEKELFDIVTKYIGDSTPSKFIEYQSISSNNISQEYIHININHLKELSRGNNSFIKDIAEIFINQIPNELLEIEKAIVIEDYHTIKSISHKMKLRLDLLVWIIY